jgi:RHS repeat-associated protein
VGTGLEYFGARYYDGSTGRFLSEDPVFLAIGTDQGQLEQILKDPQALNSYAYARNNPLKYIDPDGKTFWDVVAGRQSVGSYGNELYAGGGAPQFIMDHPYLPAAVGAAPLAVYGAVAMGPAVPKWKGFVMDYMSTGNINALNEGVLTMNPRIEIKVDKLSKEAQERNAKNLRSIPASTGGRIIFAAKWLGVGAAFNLVLLFLLAPKK